MQGAHQVTYETPQTINMASPSEKSPATIPPSPLPGYPPSPRTPQDPSAAEESSDDDADWGRADYQKRLKELTEEVTKRKHSEATVTALLDAKNDQIKRLKTDVELASEQADELKGRIEEMLHDKELGLDNPHLIECELCYKTIKGNIFHIIPKAPRGKGAPDPLKTVCYSCGTDKNYKLIKNEQATALQNSLLSPQEDQIYKAFLKLMQEGDPFEIGKFLEETLHNGDYICGNNHLTDEIKHTIEAITNANEQLQRMQLHLEENPILNEQTSDKLSCIIQNFAKQQLSHMIETPVIELD